MASERDEGTSRVEQQPADVGSRLRQAREQRGLTLQEIAKVTKISTSALGAIERNDIARLPGGLFTRGYIRAYAAAVGLNPEESTTQYLAQFESPPAEEEPPVSRGVDLDPRPRQLRLLAALVFGVGLLAYGLFSWKPAGTPPPAQAEDRAPAEGVAAVALTPAATDAPALRLEIRPRGPCWVSVRADGRVAIYRLMHRGERALVEAHDAIDLHVGDAGTFVYRINGMDGRPLGGAGDVVTIRILENTYETFLETAGPAPAGAARPAVGQVSGGERSAVSLASLAEAPDRR